MVCSGLRPWCCTGWPSPLKGAAPSSHFEALERTGVCHWLQRHLKVPPKTKNPGRLSRVYWTNDKRPNDTRISLE